MEKKVLVETSARHVHLTEEAIAALFGADAKLTPTKDLSQPGQFACAERVDVVGPKNTIKNIIILGPARPECQIEVSLTDARVLGVPGMIRESGDVAGTPGCKLVGPAGEYDLAEGVLVAKRHIHMTPEDAAAFGVADKEVVKVRVESERSAELDDVIVRVSPKYALAMHIDTDESNAGAIAPGTMGEIIK